jgi:dephospho-CoA kinase
VKAPLVLASLAPFVVILLPLFFPADNGIMLIGLTGTYCAGKNYVAALLEKRGFPVLDVDKYGYKALEMEKERVFSLFGKDLQRPDGSVDRKLLGKRVFGNPAKLAGLEAIVHPLANRMTEEWVAVQDGHCVINAALLHRSAVFGRLDRIIVVTAPLFTRLLRARMRDKLSWAELLQRFASQVNFDVKYSSTNAEIIRVENPGLSGSRRLHNKLECRINSIIEGI